MALRSFIEFGYRYSQNLEIAKFWWQIDIIWPLASALLFHFALIYVDKNRGKIKYLIYCIYTSVFVIVFLEIFADYITGQPEKMYWGYTYGISEFPIFTYISHIWFFLICFFSIIVFFIYYKRISFELEKKQTRIVLLTFSIPLLIYLINNLIFKILDFQIPELANTVFAIISLLLYYATYKYRVFDINPETAIDKIISTMSDSLLLLDPDGHIKYVNQAICKLLEYKEDELFGKSIKIVFPSKEDIKAKDLHPQIILKKKNVRSMDTVLKTKSGDLVPISISSSRIHINKEKDFIGNVCIARDITERKQKEDELKKYRNHLQKLVKERTLKLRTSTRRYISLFRDSPVPLVELDLSRLKLHLDELENTGSIDIIDYCMKKPLAAIRMLKLIKILNVNKAALNFLKALNKNEISKNLHHIIRKHTFNDMIRVLLAISLGENTFITESVFYTLENELRYIHLRLSISPQSTTSLKRVLLSCIDMTEGKLAEMEKASLEEQLRHTQKMEAIGTLAGGIAHDFNNLLFSILGYSDIIKQRLKPGNKIYKELGIIESTAEKATKLVKQLLSFARKGKKHNIIFDINYIIENVTTILKHSIDKRIRIEKKLNREPLYCQGDPGQMEQVIMNLAVNASDAMPEGGELVFSTKIIQADQDCLKQYKLISTKSFCEIKVRDTGSGISEKIKNRIFEPFFTTKEQGKGTGMGLAVAYGIVANHDGFMELESKTGRGTTFTLFLPLMEYNVQVKPETMKQQKPLTGAGNVLIVEDERVVSSVLVKMLNDLGYSTYTAFNGKEAVDRYRLYQEKIDLVIIDMVMPKMNGRDCYRELKKINPTVKAIMITGHMLSGTATDVLDEGMLDVIYKPFSRIRLAKVVSNAFKY